MKKIAQIFVAFSEKLNFTCKCCYSRILDKIPCQFSISRNRFLVVRILCLNHWVGKSWITGPIATTISSNLLLHKCTIQITLLLTGRWTGCQRNTKIALRRHLCIRAWVHTVVSGLYMAVSGVIQWLLGQEEVGKSYKNSFFCPVLGYRIVHVGRGRWSKKGKIVYT